MRPRWGIIFTTLDYAVNFQEFGLKGRHFHTNRINGQWIFTLILLMQVYSIKISPKRSTISNAISSNLRLPGLHKNEGFPANVAIFWWSAFTGVVQSLFYELKHILQNISYLSGWWVAEGFPYWRDASICSAPLYLVRFDTNCVNKHVRILLFSDSFFFCYIRLDTLIDDF